MANEKAKIIHSRKNLDAKVGCTKAVMEAKYNYRMAIQEARMIRSNQLQESETAYSEALGENTTVRCTSVCKTPQGTCKTYAQVGGTSHKRGKSKLSQLSFCLPSHPTPCSTAPQGESVYLLPHFVRAITFITLICSICQDTPGRGTAICNHFSQTRTQVVPMAKKAASFARSMGKHVHG